MPHISHGTVHKVPKDLQKALLASPKAHATWEDITPRARNEWICWIESPKKPETRAHHLTRATTELAQGKRRPCCSAGCPHH